MPIEPGTTLGPYEITGAIGAGGMGEVYKATDSRLGRIVAIKVLPDHLADDAELRQRFEQEAQVISGLNHPNICVLHDIGSANGVEFIVMEHIEVETLATRLDRGALPLHQSIEVGVQIADALDKAHRHGIVHRDLKPGNIMLAKRGVKLLDFGIAKLLESSEFDDSTEQPTRQKPLTGEGALLGTVQYMAPEQLEGKDVDARTDIFALGTVLYEMITGKKAFTGGSKASVIGAILKDEPAPLALERTLPRGLERIIRKCLAKDPEDRWHTAHDLMDALRWLEDDEVSSSGLPTARSRRPLLLTIGVATALVIAAVVFEILRPPDRSPDATSRFEINLPPGAVITDFFGPTPLAFSPDGRHLVYAASDSLGEQQQHLYLRNIDRFESSIVPGTERGHTPFFSPDGESVGFFASGKLWRIALSGGAPQEICNVSTANFARGASWGRDDSIVFTSGAASGLYRVSSRGGAVETLLDSGAVASPQVLSDGQSILFTESGRHLKVMFPNTGEVRGVDAIGEAQWARFLPTGHLVYRQGDALMAVRFDPRNLVPQGTPVTLMHGGVFGVTVADHGGLAYISGASSAGGQITIADRSGQTLRTLEKERGFVSPRFTPDGLRISAVAGDSFDVVVFDLARGSSTRATYQGTSTDYVWTADGTSITFSSPGRVTADLFQIRSGENGKATLLLEHDNPLYVHSYSPTGDLAFYEVNPETARDIWILPASGGPRKPFLVTPFNERSPAFSPDGRFIAYVSDESGRDEVYVQPYPPSGEKWTVSTAGGTEPVWTRGGTELIYRNRNEVWSVSVQEKPTFALSTPQLLFAGRYLSSRAPSGSLFYDVSPDGERFVMIRPDPDSEITKIRVVTNWFDEVERLVP